MDIKKFSQYARKEFSTNLEIDHTGVGFFTSQAECAV
jgi:hypothetical protein